jgi:hypothetical protein
MPDWVEDGNNMPWRYEKRCPTKIGQASFADCDLAGLFNCMGAVICTYPLVAANIVEALRAAIH